MNPEVARLVWPYLGDREPAVRADPYLEPLFEALSNGDHRALHAGQAARLAGCSRATLARRCRRVLGVGYAHFVMGFRLLQARRLLHEDALPVGAVATLTGFGDVAVLRHAFRRRFGVAPREEHRRDPSNGHARGPATPGSGPESPRPPGG